MLCHYLISCVILVLVTSQEIEILSNVLDSVNKATRVIEADVLLLEPEQSRVSQKVDLKIYYESLCPDCIDFDPEFARVAQELHQYVTVHTYPYGNARMTKKADGSVKVACQHGVKECYGNMLHACATDILDNVSQYLEYNSCMIRLNSNDTAAQKCGKQLEIDAPVVDAIKECAKGPKGLELLVHYGEESERVGFQYVPYVLVDGAEWNGEKEDFEKDVCAKFHNPPAPCARFS